MKSEQRKERSKELFKAIRQELGFPEVGEDVLAFSDRIGVENSSLSRWERGLSTPRGQALKQLAENVGVPSDLLAAYFEGKIELGVVVDNLAVNPLASEISQLTKKELQQCLKIVVEKLSILMPIDDLSRFLLADILSSFRPTDLLEFNRLFAAFLANRPVVEPPDTIQGLILKELAQPDKPWANSNNPLQVFAEESMISGPRLVRILDGECPTAKEIGYLQRMLSDGTAWRLEELQSLVETQYQQQVNEDKPNGAPSTTA